MVESMPRVPYQELFETLADVLLRIGFEAERARLCARLFAETTLDGVYSHGLNRFPRFIRMIRNGSVDIHARPEPIARHGAMERWDGRRGPGNLNAYQCMERAIVLSREHGVCCVALANTNHWMRGGTYGWQAADAGVAAICWTNTMPNLPPWGSAEARLGNNPLVIAVPRPGGHVVLDMAMSQFSFGALAAYRARGEQLPVDGGFDAKGNLTRNPAAIEESNRALPIGYWKGSGLAMMLDMLAAILSGGNATHQIEAHPERETGVSQVFLAFDPSAFGSPEAMARTANAVVESACRLEGGRVRYPGEHTLQVRRENMALGVPVEESVWRELKSM